MSPKSFEVNIGHKLLIWARESSGLTIDEVAKKLKVNSNIIIEWETGRKSPTLIQLEKIANSIYKRPLGVFFLTDPPKEDPLPLDLRTVPKDKKKSFSPKTRLAIRRVRRLQSIANELVENNMFSEYTFGTVSLFDDPESFSQKIRNKLRVDIETQMNWKNENIAFSQWIKTIESLGIFVLQIGMPIEESRGFSLKKDKIPVIVINSRDYSVKGKIFSLFHEFAHLLINKNGICDMGEQDNLASEDRMIEKFCNHFAGAFLVPQDALLNHELTRKKECSDENLQRLAALFKVSQEVILRRFQILGIVSNEFYKKKYEEKYEEWLKKIGEIKKQKKRGKSSPPQKCMKENGIPFVSLVIDSNKKGKITYTDVADYLGIKIKHIPKIEQIIGGVA